MQKARFTVKSVSNFGFGVLTATLSPIPSAQGEPANPFGTAVIEVDVNHEFAKHLKKGATVTLTLDDATEEQTEATPVVAQQPELVVEPSVANEPATGIKDFGPYPEETVSIAVTGLNEVETPVAAAGEATTNNAAGETGNHQAQGSTQL